jgi:CheY-like chemotaxis protein/two-component sensor histidine kinase/HPt (histidine-containing phosphotransfer) domain-containing protein
VTTQPPGSDRQSADPHVDPALGRSLEQALSQAVRTPLHSLLGFMELLAMSDLDDEQSRLHRQLERSAEDLLTGSDRILWLVRLLGEHYQPRPARVHLSAFAAEVAAASDGAVSAVVAPDAPPHLDTDLAALHQIVTELVANAVRHGAAPVVIAISPDPDARDTVRITVSDGGKGLPPATRRALAAAVDGSVPASGLGFQLVRRLAALLGGTVQVLPTHVGAHVCLVLPLTAGAGRTTSAAPPVSTAAVAPARSLRVLLVEDNATNRLLTDRQLSRLGHVLTAVASGEAGIRAALGGEGAEPFDVVLMDRHLPDIDGCEATRRIRAGLPEGRPYLPILAVTADATPEARDACTEAGMDEVLTKPVDLARLSAALDRAAGMTGREASAGAAHPTADAAPWQPTALAGIVRGVDGDMQAAAELISTYLGELPGRRLRIHASLRRGDARAVVAAAESLRTSSESLGATAVAGACAALATAAAAADLQSARQFLPSLILRCEQFSAELAGFVDEARIVEVMGAGALGDGVRVRR